MGLGPLVAADEMLNHQIVETYATVSQSDFSWTEKIWLTATATDGSLQASFGLGKYTNRGVMDGFGGIARGNEQWVVRASRTLAPDPNGLAVGPLRYEIVDPLWSVRCVLEPSDYAPIAFDLVLHGVLPTGLETPWPERGPGGYRISENMLRFHQSCYAEGWAEIKGNRVDFTGWVAFRDRSWGIRPHVGLPLTDLPPEAGGMQSMNMLWSPMLFERADGEHYGLFAFRMSTVGEDGATALNVQCAEERPTGERIPFRTVVPDFTFDPANRRMMGGTLRFVAEDGSERPVKMSPVSGIGFNLGPGGYFGYGGHTLGQWMGAEHVTGDYIPDTSRPEVAREIHQLRDQLMRVDDPVGEGSGYANLETIVFGAFPELGLTAESSFF